MASVEIDRNLKSMGLPLVSFISEEALSNYMGWVLASVLGWQRWQGRVIENDPISYMV